MLKFVLVVVLFAALTYAAFWALERRRARGGDPGGSRGTLRGPRPPRPPSRQVAPDDDEDFLRWLERKRRRDAQEPE